METGDTTPGNKQKKWMLPSLIALGALLLISLALTIIFIVGKSNANKENELLRQEQMALVDEVSRVEAEKDGHKKHIIELEENIAALLSTSEEQLQAKQAEISALWRRYNREAERLQEQIEAFMEMKEDYEKIHTQYTQLLGEYEYLDHKHNKVRKAYSNLADSIEKSRQLQVFHISPMTKWERWLWADRYHIDRASRVDQTTIRFEVAGNLFVPHGSRTIYLSMIDPQGSIMYPTGDTFVEKETNEPVSFTAKQEAIFTGAPVPMRFTVQHPDRLTPGEYMIQVYIDGALVRSEPMTLQ